MRLTGPGVFAGAFLLLLGAVGAVVAAQLTAKSLAAWLSVGYSAGAVLLTVVAVVVGRIR